MQDPYCELQEKLVKVLPPSLPLPSNPLRKKSRSIILLMWSVPPASSISSFVCGLLTRRAIRSIVLTIGPRIRGTWVYLSVICEN